MPTSRPHGYQFPGAAESNLSATGLRTVSFRHEPPDEFFFSVMNHSRLTAMAVLCIAMLARAGAADPEPQTSLVAPEPLADGLYATFHTARGEVTAELFPLIAPLTVANFVGLAEGTIPFEGRPSGKSYYDGLIFHRVVEGFVVQGGDPLGTGEGGPGYDFADEFSPKAKHASIGTLAMANSGPNTNGSQFYFTLSPVNRLNYKHTVFGRVVRGLEVLPQIKQGDVLSRVTIARIGADAAGFHPDAASFTRLRETTPVIAPRDATLPPLFADGAMLDIPEFYPGWLNDKLHHFSQARGITIFVRTFARFAEPTDDTAANVEVGRMHRELAGDDPRSATLAFSAEEKRWFLWIGEELLAPLGIGAGSAQETMHATKMQILAGALKQLEEGVTRRSVDAAVTDLIEAIDLAEFGH